MSKKRKTRKEKVLTGLRKNNTSLESSSPIYSFDISRPAHTPQPSKIFHEPQAYSYVAADMKKTFVVTSILSAASVVLYLLVQNHIVRLSIFGY